MIVQFQFCILAVAWQIRLGTEVSVSDCMHMELMSLNCSKIGFLAVEKIPIAPKISAKHIWRRKNPKNRF